MALVAKIVDVTHEVVHTDEGGSVVSTDLSLSGRFQVTVDYFDDTQPSTILLTHTFDLPVDITEGEAQQRIVAFGQRIRDARVRVNQLKAHMGVVIPLT